MGDMSEAAQFQPSHKDILSREEGPMREENFGQSEEGISAYSVRNEDYYSNQ
jgi:hypothetical protein